MNRETESKLLRAIADEAQNLWRKNQLPLEAITLKNLLTDRIDFKTRQAEMEEEVRDMR